MSSILAPLLSEPRSGDARDRVRRARPDLSRDASAFRAAVVLLAGPEHRFNIDRIAVRCALPRPWVAACVRRLIDNGVWAGGRAVYPWATPDDPRFWNDAAVAEGRLLRRTRPDGRVEWAPPGAWEKAYDFIGPQSEPGGAVLYLDPGTVDDGSPAPASSAAAPCAEREAARRATARVADAFPELRFGAPAPAGGGWMGAPAPASPFAGAGAPSLPDLFPGTDWLR
ncbi:MAG TPA: hypothetical protein VEQ60_15595 [Longimicrobium sp.]|nr:hypothetical protein [Longimicrobium sp.]